MIKGIHLGLYLGNMYLVNSEKHFPWIHLRDFITNPYKRTLVLGRNFALQLIIVQYLFQIYIWKRMQEPNPTLRQGPSQSRSVCWQVPDYKWSYRRYLTRHHFRIHILIMPNFSQAALWIWGILKMRSYSYQLPSLG